MYFSNKSLHENWKQLYYSRMNNWRKLSISNCINRYKVAWKLKHLTWIVLSILPFSDGIKLCQSQSHSQVIHSLDTYLRIGLKIGMIITWCRVISIRPFLLFVSSLSLTFSFHHNYCRTSFIKYFIYLILATTKIFSRILTRSTKQILTEWIRRRGGAMRAKVSFHF